MDKESNIVVSVNGLKFLTRFFQREFDGIIERVFTGNVLFANTRKHL